MRELYLDGGGWARVGAAPHARDHRMQVVAGRADVARAPRAVAGDTSAPRARSRTRLRRVTYLTDGSVLAAYISEMTFRSTRVAPATHRRAEVDVPVGPASAPVTSGRRRWRAVAGPLPRPRGRSDPPVDGVSLPLPGRGASAIMLSPPSLVLLVLGHLVQGVRGSATNFDAVSGGIFTRTAHINGLLQRQVFLFKQASYGIFVLNPSYDTISQTIIQARSAKIAKPRDLFDST